MTGAASEGEGLIERTTVLVARLDEENEFALGQRYARRNRLRLLDDLLEHFEHLNLRDQTRVPVNLVRHVYGLVHDNGHLLLRRPVHKVSITEWMDALYDLQDPLLINPILDDPD